MARKRKGRSLNAVLLLDKPTGASSNDILQKVRRLYGAAKAGHTGALDPLATGMLPICFGEATKFSQYLLDSDKGYRVIAKLGERTDTSDSDGEIIERNQVDVSEQQLLEAIDGFRGETLQVPSMFSALKHQGKPLYWYARQGINVEREGRPITVYRIELLRFDNDEVEMEIICSKGTYIRTIVDDLGQKLGCGAHVTMLRRIKVGDFPFDKIISLETLEQLKAESEDFEKLDELLLPPDSPVEELEAVEITDPAVKYFQNGNPVRHPDLTVGELYRVYYQQHFLGVAQAGEGNELAPKRLVVFEQPIF